MADTAGDGTVFVSHASADKPFVYRLAVDLLARGFSVWLDRWELEPGEELRHELYATIETASCVLLVVSPQSDASRWVKAEASRARQVERRRKESVVVPLLLGGTQLPAPYQQRVYIDFRESYGHGLDALTDALRRRGLDRAPRDPARTLIPLSFTRVIDLDSVALERRISALAGRLPDGFELADDQFIVAPDENYDALRRRFVQRRDGLAEDPYYSPEFQRDFLLRAARLLDLERVLIAGVRRIVNAYGFSGRHRFGEAAAWYSRGVRTRTLALLYTSQPPNDPDNVPFGREFDIEPMSDNVSAARYFGFRHATLAHLIGPQPAIQAQTGVPWHTIGMWIDTDSSIAERLNGPYQVYRFPEINDGDLAARHAIPSMVYQFENSHLQGELWDLDDCRVALP